MFILSKKLALVSLKLSCDNSGVGIFSCKETTLKTMPLFFVFHSEEKKLSTLFGDHILHLATEKNFKTAYKS